MPGLSFSALSDRANAMVLLLVVGCLLASAAIFAKAAPLFGWPPLALLQWSMLGGAVLQGATNGAFRDHSLRTVPVLAYSAGSGVLYAVPNALGFGAAQHVGAGFVALCFAFPLVVTYGLALAFRLERVQTLRLAGVISGVIGAALLALSRGVLGDVGGFGGSAEQISVWAIAALSAPVILAVGNIYRTRFWPEGATPSHLSTAMMGFGFLCMVGINLAFGQSMWPTVLAFDAFILLISQMFIFAITYDLFFRLQKLAGPVYLSQIGSVAAVVGVALAFVIFGEVPGVAQLVAALFVAAGVWLVSKRNAKWI